MCNEKRIVGRESEIDCHELGGTDCSGPAGCGAIKLL